MNFSKSGGKMALSAVAMALAALASINCGGQTGSGNGGGGAEATTSTSASGGAQPTSTSTSAGMSDPTCASAALCNEVVLFDPSVCSGGSGASSGAGGADPGNATAARCVLEKLRDRATGYVAVIVDSGSAIPCGKATELVSFGDGSATVSRRGYSDLWAGADPSLRLELKPVSYFETCLAGDDHAVLACVTDLTTSTVVAGDTCPCRGNKGGSLAGLCKVGP